MDSPRLDEFSLDDRVTIVTGAASGLGRAIAVGVAQAGATVELIDIQTEALRSLTEQLQLDGWAVGSHACDVSDPESVKDMVAQVLRVHSRIDALIHVAGIGARHRAEDYPLELWHQVLEVNLTGAFLCCQEVGRIMLAQGRGAIVTVASVAGIVGWRGSVGYQVSKAGVGQLTRSLGVEWARRGVRVNSIAPGSFDTPGVRAEAAVEPDHPWFNADIYPMGRVAQPDEIVGAAIFLASDASSYMTGQLLVIDGGFTAQ